MSVLKPFLSNKDKSAKFTEQKINNDHQVVRPFFCGTSFWFRAWNFQFWSLSNSNEKKTYRNLGKQNRNTCWPSHPEKTWKESETRAYTHIYKCKKYLAVAFIKLLVVDVFACKFELINWKPHLLLLLYAKCFIPIE